MNIAILGYGTVGKGVRKLVESSDSINLSYILRSSIDKCDEDIMTCDISKVLNDSSVDTVVECIGGTTVAYDYCIRVLKSKKNLVTANKKMVAKYFSELVTLAKENEVEFRFSASVGGSINWINTLVDISSAYKIDSISAIANGTSNFILDEMYNNDSLFYKALDKAKKLGYAESDPSDDVSGLDSANKLVISSNIAYGKVFDIDKVFTLGIENFDYNVLQAIDESERKCVLLANSVRVDGRYCLYVIPTAVREDDMFFNIEKNINCFRLHSDTVGDQYLIGQGAGSLPTANNVLNDLCSIIRNDKYKYDISDKVNNDLDLVEGYFVIKSDRLSLYEDICDYEINRNMLVTKKINLSTLKNAIDKANDDSLFVYMEKEY